MVAERPVYSPEQLAAQYHARRRRAAAMCLPDDTVLGLTLSPLTPATYSRLYALGNSFLFEAPADHIDIANYVWVHSPSFTMDPRAARPARRRVIHALERHIAPPWLRWRYSRVAWFNLVATGYARAAEQIAEIVRESFADVPPPGGDGPVIGATLEAQFIDLFAREYRWSAETIRHTPIRQLYQFLRCINRTDFDAEEAAIIAADLKRENATALAAREK